MTAAVTIRPMVAADALAIQRQPSQRIQLGLDRAMTIEEAEALVAQGEAWTAAREGVVLACLGLRETFQREDGSGAQGVAWAILSADLGISAHLAVTRHARARIAASGLRRIEAIVAAKLDAEPILADYPDLDPGELLAVMLNADNAEMAWARLVGLKPAAVLRAFGAASQTHILFERIR